MKRQSGKLMESKYGTDAAVYQPSQGQLRRTISLVFLLLTILLIGLATRAHADVIPFNSPMLQGGGYAPDLAPNTGIFHAAL